MRLPSEHDTDARLRIRDDLDSTLFVDAGAGTGKTKQLVERIVRLVTTGRARVREVAAITFTEAAAGELRDRIFESFERLASGESDEDFADLPTDPSERRLWRQRAVEAVAELDGAAITTLHGFARRLLAEHPMDAGLPPLFDVSDEIKSAVSFEERWREFVGDLLEEGLQEEAVLRALLGGITIDALKRIAQWCNANWDLVSDEKGRAAPLLPIDVSPVLTPLAAAESLVGFCNRSEDRLLRHLQSLQRFLGLLKVGKTDLEKLQILEKAPSIRAGNMGRAEDWSGKKEELVELLDQAQRARNEIRSAAARAALSHLVVMLRTFTIRGADERRANGRLEYHDLLVQARDLLRNRPSVRQELRRKYRYLLIDEFQDTDPIQAELALRLAVSNELGGEAGWQSTPVEAGRLFFVGDPKQSIYRFRRADIQLFQQVRKVIGDDNTIYLTENHRSVVGIIDWVNAVFSQLIGDGAHHAQPGYVALSPARSGPATARSGVRRPPVTLLGSASNCANVEVIRAEEAEEIAAILRSVERGEWRVRGGGEGRAAHLGDVAILIPARTAVPPIRDALDEAGLPYRLEVASLVYSSPEVVDLLTVLRAVDDPSDEVSIVAALRSASFGCGDDDLLEFRLAGGTWDYRRRAPDALTEAHCVVAGLRTLQGWHDRRWWSDTSKLIESVLADLRHFELALDGRRHRDAWRQLRFVVNEARRFADSSGSDLRRYLDWIETQRDSDTPMSEAVLPENDHQAVRIMTVHGSKGLEFPIVLLAGLSLGPAPTRAVRVLHGPLGLEVAINVELKTPGFDELAASDDQLDSYEALRRLYVAATRAQDHLIVSLHHKKEVEPKSHAALLEAICGEHPGLNWRWDPGQRPLSELPPASRDEVMTPAVGHAEIWGNEQERAEWIERRTRLLENETLGRTLSATSIAKLASEPTSQTVATSVEESEEQDPDLLPWRRGRGGTALGRAVHAVLQTIDLSTGEGLHRLALRQGTVEGIPQLTSQIEELAVAALRSATIEEAIRHRHRRELYIGAPIRGHPVEGFLDLLIEKEDGFEIIDFKTDSARNEGDLDHAVKRYRLQAATYAILVEETLGSPVTRCTFLFLRPGGAVAKDVPDLAAARSEVYRYLETGALPERVH